MKATLGEGTSPLMAAAPSLAACLHSVRAVVFDTDGVFTDSARSHAAAWKKAFDDCLRHVDGRSRQDCAAAFLASRGLNLPEGSPDDPPGTATAGAVAARKDELFTETLRTHPVDVWPGELLIGDD